MPPASDGQGKTPLFRHMLPLFARRGDLWSPASNRYRNIKTLYTKASLSVRGAFDYRVFDFPYSLSSGRTQFAPTESG